MAKKITRLLLPLVIAASMIALEILLVRIGAYAHDDWMRVYEHNDPSSGRLCCGGDETTGDCEHLTQEQVHETPQGVIFLSRRYGAQVFVPRSRVEWDYPRDGYSKNVTGMAPAYPAGWCGKPRAASPGWPVTPDDPDPNFHTFCAFLAPGGV